MKTLEEMTKEERTELFEAWFQGERIEYYHSGEWCHAIYPAWNPDTTYRIAPRKPSIDWSHVAPEYKWLARDESGEVYLYTIEPELARDVWIARTMDLELRADTFSSLDPGTCDWWESLVRRPEVTGD